MTNEQLKKALLDEFKIPNPNEAGGGLQGRIITDMNIWQYQPEKMIEWLKRTLPVDAKLVLVNEEPLQPTFRSDGLAQIITFTSKEWPLDPEGRYSIYNLNGREVIPARPAEEQREVSIS